MPPSSFQQEESQLAHMLSAADTIFRIKPSRLCRRHNLQRLNLYR